MKSGDIYISNQGCSTTIIKYINNENVVVEFNDKYRHRVKTTKANIKNGHVKNPYHPNVYGIGFLGVGDIASSSNGVSTNEYHTWMRMLERCYSEKRLLVNPTYSDVIVCDEWHNFQNFADWLLKNEHYMKGYDLDKDLLANDVKVYSPENCVFVPQEINKLLSNSKLKNRDLPTGVSFVKSRNKYKARISENGQTKNIGDFSTIKEAHTAYILEKEAYVKSTALKWKGKIDARVFIALMSWRVVEL